MSPSHDLREPPTVDPAGSHANASTVPLPEASTANSNDTTKSRAAAFADDQNLELDEEDSDNEDAELPEGSLFDYNIPGVMAKNEVAKLYLAHWKLVVRNTLIDLEVSELLR